MLDEQSKNIALDVRKELLELLSANGYNAREVSEQEANTDIPTILLAAPKNYKDEDTRIVLSIFPVNVNDKSSIAIQLYSIVSGIIPENRTSEVKSLLDAKNSLMLFGNAMLDGTGCAAHKYIITDHIDRDLDFLRFTFILDIFAHQGDNLAKSVNEIID